MDKDGKNVKNISKDFDRNVTVFFGLVIQRRSFKYDDYGITKLGILIYQDNLSF